NFLASLCSFKGCLHLRITLDNAASSLLVDRRQRHEDVLYDSMVDVTGRDRHLVRDISPPVLPNAGVSCRARDSITAPVLRPQPAPARATQTALQEPGTLTNQGADPRPASLKHVLHLLPYVTGDIELVMVKDFDPLMSRATPYRHARAVR